jgi:DNA-binding MarR family transcriptional regulator
MYMRQSRKWPQNFDAAVESIRHSVVSLRRLFQRKELAELWASAFGKHSALDYTLLRLLDAVRVSQAQDGREETTVGEIARLLGVDPSRASRLVASAVADGLLERRAARNDGRKSVLKISASGARLQARGSEVTRARIALALEDWTEHDRLQLAELLRRFVQHMLRDAP